MAVKFYFWINSPIIVFGFGKTHMVTTKSKGEEYYLSVTLIYSVMIWPGLFKPPRETKIGLLNLGTSENQRLNYSFWPMGGGNLEFDLPGGLKNQGFEKSAFHCTLIMFLWYMLESVCKLIKTIKLITYIQCFRHTGRRAWTLVPYDRKNLQTTTYVTDQACWVYSSHCRP